MLIVQYLMQFGGPPRNISYIDIKYYLECHIYFMAEDQDTHAFYLDRELNPDLQNHCAD